VYSAETASVQLPDAEVNPLSEFSTVLENHMSATETLYTRTEHRAKGTGEYSWQPTIAHLVDTFPSLTSLDINNLTAHLRVIKTAEEIATIQQAVRLTKNCLDHIRPLIQA
jgi:Xaa-Pro aminopeptidase